MADSSGRKGLLMAVAAALLVNAPTIAARVRQACDRSLMNDEERSVYPFFRLGDASLYPGDYIVDYFLAMPKPPLYELLFTVWPFDPLLLTRYLHLPLWFLTALAIGFAMQRLHGAVLAFAAMHLVFSMPIFLHQLIGGTHHSFAFPLVAGTIAGAAAGAAGAVLCLLLISTLLYPPVAPLIGLTLAYILIGLPAEARGSAGSWSLMRRLAVPALAGVFSIVMLRLMMIPAEGYGTVIKPFTDAEAFPEAGLGGRHFLGMSDPFGYFRSIFLNQLDAGSTHLFRGFFYHASLLMLPLCFLLRDQRSQAQLRVWTFLASTVAAFALARLADPTQIYRYLLYPVPVLLTISLPLVLSRISRPFLGMRRGAWAAAALTVLYSLVLDPTNLYAGGYHGRAAPAQLAALDFLANLPEDAVIAGLPGYRNLGEKQWEPTTIELVPYLAKRSALLTYKMHHPVYVNYTLEMRRRMSAVIAALYNTSLESVLLLRDELGVDYLIVEHACYSDAPRYFAPFGKILAERWSAAQQVVPAVQAVKGAAVFDQGCIYILNLQKLEPGDAAQNREAAFAS